MKEQELRDNQELVIPQMERSITSICDTSKVVNEQNEYIELL